MRNMMRTLPLLALLAVPAAYAAEDDQRLMAALANASEQLMPQVATVLAHQQRQISAKCPLGKLVADEVNVMELPAFNLDGMPERGDWHIRYTTTACKEKVARSASFHATAKGVQVEAGAPGDSRTDGRLAKDVWASFQKAAVRAKPGCTAMVLRDTKLVETPKDGSSIWREAWIGRVCGQEMGQIVSFYPTPRGTMFRMSLPSEELPEQQLAPTYQPVR